MAQLAHNACAEIERRVEDLRNEFPTLEVSFGYVGNVEFWGDDRLWSVHARPYWMRGVWKSQHTFGACHTDELPVLLENWERDVVSRVQRLVAEPLPDERVTSNIARG